MKNISKSVRLAVFCALILVRFCQSSAIAEVSNEKPDSNLKVIERAGSVVLQQEKNVWKLENSSVGIKFDTGKRTYSVFIPKTGEIVIANAVMAGNLWDPAQKSGVICRQAGVKVKDASGEGVKFTFTVTFEHSALPEYLFSYTLYDGDSAIRMGFGMNNTRKYSIRLMTAEPLSRGQLKLKLEQPMTLNGGAGAETTLVKEGLTRSSANSLLLTGLTGGHRRTIVWGGLQNRDFGKWASIGPISRKQTSDIVLGMKADDPVGRLVDSGKTYWAEDTFYLDVSTDEPFLAMEKYGRAIRLANNAKPNVYDFPVLCGWSVGALSHLPNVNNSKLLVKELEAANACGLTRYTKVGIRLEPDKYHNDTEQGWWDDAHWAKYQHLVEPYETMAKFCQAVSERNGIPYTYFQVGMPSDDYSLAFPGHMLRNDISRLAVYHSHHQPLVSYDYTDPDFRKHMKKVWGRLSKDGMRGIKFDYPETGWRPEGGFEDRYTTTASAYREAFRLAREGLGPDAFLDERNLGESGRPCLDVTAGLVDTQRNWTDSNEFSPAMVTIGGLRWYKSRTVFNYFPDTKTVHDLSPEVRRSMLTMMFLTSGRIDLATSFTLFTPDIVRDFSRIYPAYFEPFSARPLDAFTGVQDPQVYDLELAPDWHQIALYNTGDKKAAVSVNISGERAGNAVGLDPAAFYHAYEFWTDKYIGKLQGTATLGQELNPNCCAMISLRKLQPNPQVLSTDRHILQGWVDLKDVRWDAEKKTLSGTASVIGGESFKIVVADNDSKVIKAEAAGAAAQIVPHSAAGLSCLTLSAPVNTNAGWVISYK